MTRGKFRLMWAISTVCLVGALLIQHNSPEHMGAEDFLRGMGYTVLIGAMVLKVRHAKPQQ